jgi:hypothetical protein
MFELIGLLVTGFVGVGGYIRSRDFVHHRLRYVDRVQQPAAPFVAGTAAAIVALPLVAVIPLIGVGTALVFGAAVGAGTRAGAFRIRSGYA